MTALKGVLAAGVAAIALLVAATPAPAAQVTVPAGDFYFCDPSFQLSVCTTTVQAGDTVTWTFSGSQPHTATECGASCDAPTASPLFDSGVVAVGGPPYSFTFTSPGTYLYYCAIHPIDMRGAIVVEAADVEPPPDDGGQPGDPSPPEQPAPQSGDGAGQLPGAGAGPGGPDLLGWPLTALAAAGLVLVAGAFVARRRNSRRGTTE